MTQTSGCFPKIVLIGGALIAVGFVLAALNGSPDKSRDTPENAPEQTTPVSQDPQPETINGTVGKSVRLNDVFYRVEEVTYTKSIETNFGRKTADGVYLVIKMWIKNIGKETRAIDNSFFKVIDERDTEYSTSIEGEAALSMSGMPIASSKQCQPGIETTGYLVFEIPIKDDGYHLKIRGELLSASTANIVLVGVKPTAKKVREKQRKPEPDDQP